MLITIQMTVMMMMMNTHHSSEIFPVNFHFEFHSMDEADWYLITNFLSAFFYHDNYSTCSTVNFLVPAVYCT